MRVKVIKTLFDLRDGMFWYPRCRHLSHRFRIPCWRPSLWQSYCAGHNQTCMNRHG